MSMFYELPLIGSIIEMLLTVVAPFLVVISIVVFIHELGHYLVGRWCGIHADAFSIGFGREIVGWTDQRGTRWKVSLLPLGGYVKFKGDADAASAGASGEVKTMSAEERRQTLTGAPIWARMLTILAGPMANFLLTIVLVFIITLANGVRNEDPVIGAVLEDSIAARAGLQVGDRVLAVNGQPVSTFKGFGEAMEKPGDRTELLVDRGGVEQTVSGDFRIPAEIGRVQYGAPADLACLRPGDVVTAVDGSAVGSFLEMGDLIRASGGDSMQFTVQRDGAILSLELTPRIVEQIDPDTEELERRYIVGVTPKAGSIGVGYEMRPAGFVDALSEGVEMPLTVARQTFGYIGAVITGEASGSSFSSLFGIANASGRAASIGFWTFVGLIALISAAIGLMNLLPIPVLDGGHLVFYTLEAIRGKPVGERWLEIASVIGLAAILMLFVFATTNDVSPWVAKIAAPSC